MQITMGDKIPPIVSHHHRYLMTQEDKETAAISRQTPPKIPTAAEKIAYDTHMGEIESQDAAEVGRRPYQWRTTVKTAAPCVLSTDCVDCSILMQNHHYFLV